MHATRTFPAGQKSLYSHAERIRDWKPVRCSRNGSHGRHACEEEGPDAGHCERRPGQRTHPCPEGNVPGKPAEAMRIVAALGGNALLERGEPPESEIQEKHIRKAVTALAPLAREHELVITHGNGPQVGLLALESAGDPALAHPYPLDVLGAQTQGMIGYWLVQALQNALPGRQVACLVSRTLVREDDPAFADPSKFVGPVYDEQQARALAAIGGWQVRPDGRGW